jgi:hypothetical protein
VTDYNWFSEEAIEVAADGLRAEAKKWFAMSDRMAEVATLAAGQNLELSAFAVTDITGPVTAFDLQHGYDKMHVWLTELFRQAVGEFESLGEALNTCADWYETTDANRAQDFDSIATS